MKVAALEVPLGVRFLSRHRIARPRIWLTSIFFIVIVFACSAPAQAQFSTDPQPGSLHGVVVNSATHEPIPRALVYSPDNRFATLTDSQGRFEFSAPQRAATEETQSPDGLASSDGRPSEVAQWIRSVPGMLMARKPGFLQDPSGPMLTVQQNAGDWTIALIPESLVVGKVALANGEAPDSIQLELYRRLVQDGRARWVFMKATASHSNGEFRFADLPAGTYKLLTRELLDRDPMISDPRGQLYAYPPAYYPAARGFSSAAEITLGAGESVTANLTITRQPYYNVRIPVISSQPGGVGVDVFPTGNRGPGYALGYNMGDQAIEGMLPNGTYEVEATSYAANGTSSGSVVITIRDGVVSAPPVTLTTGGAIPVVVKEEFTDAQKPGFGFTSSWTIGGRRFTLTGPRAYLNLSLEPEDDFGHGRTASLRAPTGASDQSLVVENVFPGRYWVRVSSARGYVASMRSGNIDLLHHPLPVGEGGRPEPIEITMRDETAEIEGTVEGISPSPALASSRVTGGMIGLPNEPRSPAHVYCIPLGDSAGSFMEMWVSPDGTFHSAPLAPGSYRVLAFARPQPELEYHNPAAMQAYESKGAVVRLSGGQKETVRIPLISPE